MKNKTKRNLIRLLRTILVVLLVINILGSVTGIGNKAYAAFGTDLSALGALVTGIAGILLLLPKIMILIIGSLIQAIMSAIYSSVNNTSISWVGLEDIVFAGAKKADGTTVGEALSVNFFDFSIDTNTTAYTFREAIAEWYYILRLISAAILLVILIYVGIRMAISTIASEQAKYKKMLMDWVTSIALLFLLHYIIIFTITANNAVVSALYDVDLTSTDFLSGLWLDSLGSGVDGLFLAIMYVMYLGMMFVFFLTYIKRMITVGFLIMISPLITITYSIDKIGDGRAQALNAWLKEFIYNVIIQIFHCVLYLAFFKGLLNDLQGDINSTAGLSSMVLAMIVMWFMVAKAEKIIKEIFHVQANSMSSVSDVAQSAMNATGKVREIGTKAGKAITDTTRGVKSLARGASGAIRNRNAEKEVKKNYLKQKQDEGMTEKEAKRSFRKYSESEDYKTAVKTTAKEMKEEKDAKREEKARENYEKTHTSKQLSYDDYVEQKAKAAYDRENGDGAWDKMKADKEKKLNKDAKAAYNARYGEGKYEELEAKAKETDKNGNKTQEAKKAQNELNSANKESTIKNNAKEGAKKMALKKEGSKERERVAKDLAGGRVRRAYGKVRNSRVAEPVKRTVTGIKDTKDKVYSSMRKFAKSDLGQAVGSTMKSSMKVAATLAGGAFAGGMTGRLNDVWTGAELGRGLAEGTLENSTRTVTNDTAEKLRMTAELNGVNPKDKDEMEKLIASISMDGAQGQFDAKELERKLKDIENSLKSELKKFGNEGNLRNIMNEIKAKITKDEFKLADIQNIVNNNVENASDENVANIQAEATSYANILLNAAVYNGQTAAEKLGVDSTDFHEDVVHRANKEAKRNETYNYSGTETEDEEE